MGWVAASRWNRFLSILENITIILCTWYFISHIDVNRKRTLKMKLPVYLAYGISFTLFSVYLPPEFYFDFGGVVIMIVATVCIGHFLYNESRMYLFYYFLYPVSIFIIQTLVSYMAYSYNIARWGLLAFDYYNDNVALLVRILSICLLTGIWVLLVNRKKYENVSKLQFTGLFLPPLFSIFIILSLIMLGNVYVQMYGAFLIVINITLLVLMNLYSLYLFSYLSRNRKLKDELEILGKQREMQYRYYENLERRYQSSRQMIHDIRNHLQAMESLVQDGQNDSAGSYVGDMYQMLNALGRVQYSDNQMLNIILNDKAENARATGITLDIDMGDICLKQMKDIDITTVFANLLDNAVEAADSAASDKYIKIRAGTFHDFAVIKIQNAMSAEYESRKKRMKDKTGHMGIGLENVRRTLKKYGGGIQTEATEREYKVSITIPMEESDMNQKGCDKYEKEI